MRFSALVALFLIVLAGPARSDEFVPKHSGKVPLGPVHSYLPPQGHAVDGLVILISGDDGWTPATAALAQHLAEEGQAVVGLELPAVSSRPCRSANTGHR
jgi:type IV secretory pathway VirJ component